MSRTPVATTLAAALAIVAAPAAALEVDLLFNGDFEAGPAGWTFVDAPGAAAWFIDDHAGGTTPLSGSPHPPPLAGGGDRFAVFDNAAAMGGGAVLAQSFILPADATALTLSIENFINDSTCADVPPVACASPAGIADDLLPGPGKLYSRFDFLAAAVPAGDLLLDPGPGLAFALEPAGFDDPSELFGGNPWLFSGTIPLTGALTPGEAYWLRLGAVVDDGITFNVGYDNIRLTAILPDVPVPAAAPLLLLGLGALGLARRRRGAVTDR